MVKIAICIVALAAPVLAAQRFQMLDGPDFTALLIRTEARCPASPVRYTSPAALLDAENAFITKLGQRDRHRLTQAIVREADGWPRSCADSPGGASCPASATLEGMHKAALLDRFATFACGQNAATWR